MFLVLVIVSALGAPDGYRQTKEGYEGCNLFLGPKGEDGVVPMRAECVWADVTVEKFDGIFNQWPLHADIFSTVQSSEVLSQAGDVSEVRQVQVTKGIQDRYIVMTGTRTALDGGGFRYQWTRTDGTNDAPSGTVPVARSDGYWQVRPAASGGVEVVYDLAYDPGGSVPGFLVRWFQTSGLQGIVSDLRTYMTK